MSSQGGPGWWAHLFTWVHAAPPCRPPTNPPLPPLLPARSVDQFVAACDPNRENLCLYGFPDGTWHVDLPAEEVPPEIPEPALGINFARDGMQVRSTAVRLIMGQLPVLLHTGSSVVSLHGMSCGTVSPADVDE